MFNMSIGATSEAYESSDERKFDRWLKSACAILGISMEDCKEDMLFALYEAGSTPDEAAAEVVADEELGAQVSYELAEEARAERCLSPGYGT